MDKDAVVALVASFAGGFLMTWLRGYKWFGEGMTYIVALAGGAVITYLLGASNNFEWMLGIMAHTLTVFGAVHVGGGLAQARSKTGLPAEVLPKFNELSN